jgi:hypothetical protein
MKNIFQSAVDNWPEDEAALLIDNWKDADENGWSPEEIREGVIKDVFHMRKVFSFEPDGAELFSRFLAKVMEKYPDVKTRSE